MSSDRNKRASASDVLKIAQQDQSFRTCLRPIQFATKLTKGITTMSRELTDKEIRDLLEDIDQSDRQVSSWEAEFLDHLLYKYDGPLSVEQRGAAERMIERYGYYR